MATDPSNAVYSRPAEIPSIGATIGLIWFFVLILSLIATQVPRADATAPVALSYFADFD
jgi:hypothetical protein